MVLDLYNSDMTEKMCKSLQNKELTKMTTGPIIKSSRVETIPFQTGGNEKKLKRRNVCREKIKQWDSSVTIRIR